MNPSNQLARLIGKATLGLFLCVFGCEMDVGPGHWDNPYDPQGTNYHPPTVAVPDTAIHDGADGRLSARAASSSPIVKVAWTLDGILLATTDTLLSTSGWEPGAHLVTAQATDSMGLTGPVGEARVWIGNQSPVLQAVADSRVVADQPIHFQLAASDLDGAIVSIAWDTVAGQYAQVSNAVQLPPLPEGGTRTVYWRATDNEGASVASSFRVGFVPPPQIAITLDYWAAAITNASGGNGSAWNVRLAPGGSIGLVVSVGSPGFADEPLTVVVAAGSEKFPCEATDAGRFYGLPDFGLTYRCTEAVPTSTAQPGFSLSRNYSARVTDPFGRVATAQVTVNFLGN